MSKIIRVAALAVTLSSMSLSSAAYAEPKPWVWSWWGSHWENQDFIPYLENGKHPHNTQWNGSGWQPEHWEAQRADAMTVIRGFYAAGILRDQYADDEVPVLEVGPGFYALGGYDKRRVAEMVDYVYGITAKKPDGMFMLYDWETEEAIGSYTRYGLQLQ